MPPKASRATAAHDDPEVKATAADKKNGHGNTNGKMRRVASQTGSNLKDVQNAASLPTPAVEATANVPAPNPSVSFQSLCERKAFPSHHSYFLTSYTRIETIAFFSDFFYHFADTMVHL